MPRPIRLSVPLLVAGLALALANPGLATITYSPNQPNVDQAATFVVSTALTFLDPATVTWWFGDGATASGQITVQHIYGRAGVFNVRCTYRASGFWFDETVPITVVENRRVTATPANPQLGQSVAFQAFNFLSGSILWNFGDGSAAVVGGASISHAYTAPGVFVAAARDKGGAGLADITVTVTVAVDISVRSITFTPAVPVPLQPVAFTAVRFFTSKILWSFGDGSAPVSGGPTISHVFAKTGVYAVQAWDWNGAAGGPTSVSVRVEEPVGPRAPFGIFFLQLRFEDGLSYKVVPRGFAGLKAYADIKYEGTGILQAQWLVDGMPFRAFSQTLPFAEAATFDSGLLPSLPTQMTGMHEVSLRLLSPATSLTMPVIRYFVTAETGLPPLRGLALQVAAVEGLKGLRSELRLDSLKAPTGAYFILNGSVTYAQGVPLKFGLLRVHLDQELVDLQILRDLRPGETRSFKTSIFNPSPEARTIYLTLYDITDPNAPKLLYLKKIAILPQD